MEIRQLPIADVKPAPYNPRKDLKPTDPEYRAIRRSLETFGLVEPLVWNEATRTLVGGHMRLKVLRDLGLKEIPVAVVNIKEPKLERALNVALNKIEGDWERNKLKQVLADLDDGSGIIDSTGYEEEELKELIDYERGGPKPDDGEPTATDTAICPKCGNEFPV